MHTAMVNVIQVLCFIIRINHDARSPERQKPGILYEIYAGHTNIHFKYHPPMFVLVTYAVSSLDACWLTFPMQFRCQPRKLRTFPASSLCAIK